MTKMLANITSWHPIVLLTERKEETGTIPLHFNGRRNGRRKEELMAKQ